MDKERVKFVKWLYRDELESDWRFDSYVQALPRYLRDKVKAERKILLENDDLRKRANKLGDIVRSTLRKELKLEWKDFWEIYETCDLGRNCPLRKYLGMEHPAKIWDADLSDGFAYKVDPDVWVEVFRDDPELVEILKSIEEVAYTESVLYWSLYVIMKDKLEEALEEVEAELDEIEKVVEGEFTFPLGETNGELEVDPYDVRMEYLKDAFRVLQDPTARSRFDIWLVRNVKTHLDELYTDQLLWARRDGREDETSPPSSEEIDLNEELLIRLVRLFMRDEVREHLKEIREKFAKIKEEMPKPYQVEKFLRHLSETLRVAYTWIVENLREEEPEVPEEYYEEEGERLQKQLMERFLRLLLKELDRELTLRKRRGRRPDRGNELIFNIIDQFRELVYRTEDGWNRIFDVTVKEKASQTLDGEVVDVYYAVPKTSEEYRELLLEFVKRIVRSGQDLSALWSKLERDRDEIRQEWVNRMRDILTTAEVRALFSKRMEYRERGEWASEHRWDYRQIDSLSLKLFDLLVELIDELVSEERIVVGRPVFEE